MPIKTVSVDANIIEGFKVEAKTGNHVSLVDQPVPMGGSDAGPSPVDYFLIALAGCIATMARIIGKQKRYEYRGINIKVDGDLDTDVLMGIKTEPRPGFYDIRVHISIDSDMTQEQKEAFVEEIDSRCPISDNIVNASKVSFVVS